MDPWRRRGDSQIRSFFLLNPPPAGTCGSATGAASAWGISQSAKGPKNRPSYAARFTIWCCAWSPSSRSVGNKILQDLDSRGQSRSAEDAGQSRNTKSIIGRSSLRNASATFERYVLNDVAHVVIIWSDKITLHSIVYTTCIKSNTYAAVH